MKNGDIITAYETLKRLSDNKELKLNVTLGYILAKNKEKLRQEAMIIYNMRKEIIMEYGSVDGKDIIVPKEYLDEVNKKIDDLMNIENDVQVVTIPIEMLEHYELNMEDIEGLLNLIQPFVITGPQINNH